MTFKYFDRPDIFTDLKENENTCDFCEQTKSCFDAESFYGRENINAICPDCLATGKLYKTDAFTCSGDTVELKRQIKELYPNLTDKEVEQQVKVKTEELEKTTPHLVTWQDWDWPCADGDYCQFKGFGSKALFKRFSEGNNEKEFFVNSIYYNLRDSDLDYLWEEVIPEKEIKNYIDSMEYGALFYIFKSLNSDKVVTIWDCN